MLRVVLLCAAVACCAAEIKGSADEACVPSVTQYNGGKRGLCKGDLIFEDSFDFLDMSKWQHEVTMAGGGNREFQIYWQDAANSFVQDGNLRLRPGKTADVYGEDFLSSGTIDLGSSCTVEWDQGCYRTGDPINILNPTTSARLHTVKSFAFLYGKVEVNAKMPAGDWLWPAIWMMPRDSVYGQWPASGEIDIMEGRGNRDYRSWDGKHFGVEQAACTMHWGPQAGINGFSKTHWERQSDGNGYNNAYHRYQLEWTPDYIKFSLDDIEMGTIWPPGGGFWELGEFDNTGLPNPWQSGSRLAPFDKEFYLILNLAIGGMGYFPDGFQNPGGKPWSNQSPQAFKDFWDGRGQWEPTWWQDGSADFMVDYVRVWAL